MFDPDKDDFFQSTAQFFLKNTQMMFTPFLNDQEKIKQGDFQSLWEDYLGKSFSASKSSENFNFEKLVALRGAQVGSLYKWFMAELLQSMKEDPLDFSKQGIDQIYSRLSERAFHFFKEHVVDDFGSPPLWLEHDSMKKITSAFEAYTDLMNAMACFSDKFSIPFKKSLADFIQKTGELEKIDPVQDPKKLYKELVKNLDKEYDDFLKTEQGVETVMDVVDKLLVYQQRINDVKEIWFKFLSIPTKAEMEDIYKNIYAVKKQNRELESRLKKQDKKIEKLLEQINALSKTKTPVKKQRPVKKKAKEA